MPEVEGRVIEEEYEGIWVNPANLKEIVISLDDFELQLIVLALSWAVEKSELKAGAQTKPLRKLEKRIRKLLHQRVSLVNKLDKIDNPDLEE